MRRRYHRPVRHEGLRFPRGENWKRIWLSSPNPGLGHRRRSLHPQLLDAALPLAGPIDPPVPVIAPRAPLVEAALSAPPALETWRARSSLRDST